MNRVGKSWADKSFPTQALSIEYNNFDNVRYGCDALIKSNVKNDF